MPAPDQDPTLSVAVDSLSPRPAAGSPRLVAVLDMGASAIRLAIAEEQVYLASADWMSRNLDRRVELMFPVEHPAHKATILHALRAMFRDNVKARVLGPDGTYMRATAGAEPPCRVQVQLQEEARRRATQAIERAGVTFRPVSAT